MFWGKAEDEGGRNVLFGGRHSVCIYFLLLGQRGEVVLLAVCGWRGSSQATRGGGEPGAWIVGGMACRCQLNSKESLSTDSSMYT